MELKPHVLVIIVTVTIIFLYIRHQNTIIRLTCEQQRIERVITQLKHEEQTLTKTLSQICSLDGVAQHARELGMEPTAVTRLREMPVGTMGSGTNGAQ
jgi:hypothetical protein